MKTYYLNNEINNVLNDTKEQLLRILDNKIITALELAIAGDDARRIHNIISEFMVTIYRETGVWYDNFDYYYEYGDNLNGYVSLIIKRINDIFD